MLIEIIFKGFFSAVNFIFLKQLLSNAKEVRFNFPEIAPANEFVEVVNVVNLNRYIDLVISTDCLDVNGKIISRVFINLGRNNEKAELLFFLTCLI